MAVVLPALRFLGLAAGTAGRAAAAPHAVSRPARLRVRTARDTSPRGSRRTVVDAELLLGPTPVPATPGSTAGAQRSGRLARDRRLRPLVALGLARPPIVVSGHPRIRERMLEGVRRRHAREQMLTTTLAVLLLAALLSWGALRSPLMGVESVSVVGVESAAAVEVEAAAGLEDGVNVLDVDLEVIRAEVAALPWVDTATVRRRLPSTVEIRVAAREPVVAGTFADQQYLIDADGIVTAVTSSDAAEHPGGLPTMPLPAAPVVGEPVAGAGVTAIAEVAAAMPVGLQRWVIGYEPTEEGQVDARLRVPHDRGPLELVVHLGGPEDIAAKATTTASLIEDVLAQGLRPTALDVRIPDRPVIRV